MSIITLQIGQCGNQIGHNLFSFLYEDIKANFSKTDVADNDFYVKESINKWFNVNEKGQWRPRSILIDTESKVTNANCDTQGYKFRNIVSRPWGGSANNWAYGYMSTSNLLLQEVIESTRREVEECDFITSIVNILGSSGGTGSGVGSKIIETLREEYPNKIIVNSIVLPYYSGEIVTQSYNSYLTLAKLYNVTDMMFVFDNQKLHNMIKKSLHNIELNFCDLNYVIAQQLSTIFQPASNMSLSNLVANLSAHPSYRFIEIHSAPHSFSENLKFEGTANWIHLFNRLKNCLKSNILYQKFGIANKKKFQCVGNVLITRGSENFKEEDSNIFRDSSFYVPWLPVHSRCTHYHQDRKFHDNEKFVTLLSNNNNIAVSLNNILEDAWTLFTHKAYLHHYTKFGLEEQDFLDSFKKLETILYDYQTL